MAKNNARLINEDVVGLYNSAGINPVTGQPTRATDNRSSLKNDIRKQLRIIDEQDAVNRYVWYNLPCDLTGQELERMLYYKGQLAFFYFKDLDEFYFMPYALDGTIDFYGRFNTIHPVKPLFQAGMCYVSGHDDSPIQAQASRNRICGKLSANLFHRAVKVNYYSLALTCVA